ncbi:hypothetical protein J3A83DRAFT_25313 [Scleroderma citrinum]
MLFMLDHPGFIRRSLAATQVTENREHFTDVKKWHDFSLAYREDIANVNLLGTVLLATNVSFLAIQSIDNAGLSYLPQKFSYMSLLAALASIMMGSAVRIPRLRAIMHPTSVLWCTSWVSPSNSFCTAFCFSSWHSSHTVFTTQQPLNSFALASLGCLCYFASSATG